MKRRELLDFFYPARCPVCDGVLLPEEDVCSDCRSKLKYISGPRCFQCGKPLENTESEYCHDCFSNDGMSRKHIYDSGLSLYEYESVKDSIYRFKYKGRCEYADFYGKEIAERLGDRILSWHPDALIPVPLFKKKERVRGYNQAALLADAIGERLHIPVRKNLVIRQRPTVPLKELDPVQRQINLKKAFNISSFDVKLNCIIIVDDIYTTGSTVDEMAKILKSAGIRKVYFITLAIGSQ